MKWYMDKEYIKKHIKGYIEFQLRQGYQLSDIKTALLKYGYEKDLVEDILNVVDVRANKPKGGKPSLKDLNEDLYVYLQNLLVDYIKKEQEAGYTIDVIKKALINYGHHPTMVKKAVRIVHEGGITDLHRRLGLPVGLSLLLSLAMLIGFVGFIVTATSASISIAGLAFAPVLVTIFMNYLIVAQTTKKKVIHFMPVISVAVVVGLFVLALQISPAMRKLSEPGTILLLNVFLGFVTSSVICLLSKGKTRKITIEDIEDPSVQTHHKIHTHKPDLEQRVEKQEAMAQAAPKPKKTVKKIPLKQV